MTSEEVCRVLLTVHSRYTATHVSSVQLLYIQLYRYKGGALTYLYFLDFTPYKAVLFAYILAVRSS